MDYREQGFLPHAILNYLVRLGWSHGDQEIFSREEMIALFDISDVNKAASRFDTEKLDRKSTRLNSSHPSISYAVFCLKKKKKKTNIKSIIREMRITS